MRIAKILFIVIGLWAMASCNSLTGLDKIEYTDSDNDTSSEVDGDADGDTDTDTDADTDTDTDTDTDADTDADTDTDVDTDRDSETDTRLCKPGETRPCGNALGNCSRGTEVCQNDGMKWSQCSISPSLADNCTPNDDANCNGIPNEECACSVGDTQTCGPPNTVGICKKGELSCSDGTWSGDCIDAVMPLERDCGSPKDNDCDGTPDNAIDAECPCLLETTQPCDPYNKGGKGICTLGSQVCEYGDDKSTTRWGECKGAVPPQEEVCDADNIDENCNGIGNEDCACSDGETQNCGSNTGICEFGKRTCIDGEWSNTCEGEVLPAKRDCVSDEDNDCDGKPDNTIDSFCRCAPGSIQACDKYMKNGAGICTPGTETCEYGSDTTTSKWGTCEGAVAPQEEICDPDMVDENCDGKGNEDCVCTNGETQNCGSNTGICEFGKRTCIDGEWSNTCEGGITAGTRDCTSTNDNDCNNFRDNIIDDVCKCAKGATRSCQVGGQFGICAEGTQSCVLAADNSSSTWGTCVSLYSKSTEICDIDSKDEDCDGTVNEGCECTGTTDSRCDDALDCTDDRCQNGKCVHEIKATHCLINSKCYSSNTENPSNSCQYCDSVKNRKEWTQLSDSFYDDRSRLCWENPPSDYPFTFAEAKSYCEKKDGDWRMPDIYELISLIRGCASGIETSSSTLSVCDPYGCVDDYCSSILNCGFGCEEGYYWPNGLSGKNQYYWSSTYYEGKSRAMVISFGYGAAYTNGYVDGSSLLVRCVRGEAL